MAVFSISYRPQQTEFSVENGDFSALEIRDAGNGSGFHYFFDTKNNKLITDFVLEDRPRVATLCQVTLIKKDGQHSPRFRFWKKDKTKLGKQVLEYEVGETEVTKIIKASVDTDDAYQNLWKLIHFLESFAEVALPDSNFRIVTRGSAQLAKAFEGQDKETILEAVKIAVGGELTEEDLRLMSNRKAQLEVFDQLLHDDGFFERSVCASTREGWRPSGSTSLKRTPGYLGTD